MLKCYFSFLLIKCVDNVVKTTILMELSGIKIAAITGARFPVTAKLKPTRL